MCTPKQNVTKPILLVNYRPSHRGHMSSATRRRPVIENSQMSAPILILIRPMKYIFLPFQSVSRETNKAPSLSCSTSFFRVRRKNETQTWARLIPNAKEEGLPKKENKTPKELPVAPSGWRRVLLRAVNSTNVVRNHHHPVFPVRLSISISLDNTRMVPKLMKAGCRDDVVCWLIVRIHLSLFQRNWDCGCTICTNPPNRTTSTRKTKT